MMDSQKKVQDSQEDLDQNKDNLLPPQNVYRKDHNIFYTGLTVLIKKVKDYTQEGKQVQNEDVGQFITSTTQLEPSIIKLQNYLKKMTKKNQDSKISSHYQGPSLGSIFWYMTGGLFLKGLALSIMQNAVGCSAIFVLDLITDELKNSQDQSKEQKVKLCLMIFGIVILYFIKNILFSQYTWGQAKWKSQCRTTLQYVAFTKQLKSKIFTTPQQNEHQKTNNQHQTNDKNKNNKKKCDKIPDINNIMTVDVNQCLSLYWSLIETISSLITLTIVLFLIYYKIGSAILSGIYVLIGSFMLNLILTLSMSVNSQQLYFHFDNNLAYLLYSTNIFYTLHYKLNHSSRFKPNRIQLYYSLFFNLIQNKLAQIIEKFLFSVKKNKLVILKKEQFHLCFQKPPSNFFKYVYTTLQKFGPRENIILHDKKLFHRTQKFKNLYDLFLFKIQNNPQYLYSKQYRKKDKRVILTKDVLDGIKSIKYLGWESVFQKKIEKTRAGEYNFIMATRCLDGIISVFWNSISYFLLFFFLADFVSGKNDLADSNVFTIIALFGYLTYPMGILPWSIGYLVKIRVSFKRISSFLQEREIYEESYQKKLNSKGENSMFVQEFQHEDLNQEECAIQIRNTKFLWPTRQVNEDDHVDNKNRPEQQSLHEYLLRCDYIQEGSIDEHNKQFQLNIEDLHIKKGTLTVIVGRTGCGKSALLNAILREMDKSYLEKNDRISISLVSKTQQSQIEASESQVFNNASSVTKSPQYYLNGKIAYVSQNHWLQNKTIRENILFGQEYNPKVYENCLKVCELKEDLKEFVEGDQKLVGPNGSNLSGGQKQRVALCRAIYYDADIYLLDDIFSSLDAHVAKRIFIKSVKKLLVEKQKKTVLMVTSHFDVLKAGKITTQQMLLIDRGIIVKDQQVIEQFMKTSKCFNFTKPDAEKIRKFSQSIEEFDFQQIHITQSESFESSSRSSSFSSQAFQKEDTEIIKQECNSQDVNLQTKKKNEEVREQSSIKLQTVLTYFHSMGYIFLTLFLIFNFLMQASQMLIDFWLRDYTHQESSFFKMINNTFDTFTKAFFFLVLLNLGFTALRSFFYCICALLSSRRIFLKINKYILFSKMKFFDNNPVGRILSRLSDDVDSVDYYLPWQSQTFMEQLAYSIGYPAGIIIQFPWIVVIIFVCFCLIYYVQKYFRDSNREIKRLNSVNTGKVLNVVSECGKGVVTIRAFQNQDYILKDFYSKLNESVNTFAVSQGVQVWMMIRLLTISNLVFAFVSISSIVIVIFNFNFNYTTIAMCLTYSILLSTRFSDLMQYFCNVEQYFISVERIRQYFSNEQEKPKNIIGEYYYHQQDNTQSINYETKEQLIQQLSQQKSDSEIEFRNIYLCYDEQKVNPAQNDQENFVEGQQDKSFALKGISFKIQKGEKIAFCGRTGSGKSSILNLLFGMYPFQKGEIFVKGQNLKVLTLSDLRQQMSVIPQFGFLFKSTLRDNLDPTEKLSDNIIHDKIAMSGISLDTIQFKEYKKSSSIRSENETKYQLQLQQEANLDSLIQEGGANLSNGQSQIINFLRIILKDSEIICLDEATSNMDPVTDQLFSQALFSFVKNKTLLVVTHRLENIDKFDRVIVLEGGKIAECGHVSELRKIEDGFFNRLLENRKQNETNEENKK